jgi:chemotaxis protein MotA
VVIGILLVFGAVAGGYLMEHGNLHVLMQPAELIRIGGAALGTVLVANPFHILKQIVGGLVSVFKGSKCTRQFYLDSLKTMYDLFNKARREGLIALESDVEEPEKSPIFSKNPNFLKDHHIRDFVCDTMRMAVTGGIEPFDMDQMCERRSSGANSRVRRPATAQSQ